MANREHIAILRKGVEVWNKWREDHPDIKPDLSGESLKGVNPQDGSLAEAFLNGWVLDVKFVREAYLRGFEISEGEPGKVYLTEGYFGEGGVINPDLGGANLRGVNLGGAYLSGIDLQGADFENARIGWTTFGDIDLSQVKNLDKVIHTGPSTIGIDTIYKSNGKIPEVFLRGVGADDTFIEFIRSQVNIKYYRCFISHSSKDKSFCERFYADLQKNGVRAWYFPEDAKWGETVWGEIDRTINDTDKLVVVCSKDSLQSGPVLREVDRALNREDREGKNVLLPILLDDYLFESWQHSRKADILRNVVGDFRGWHQTYTKYDKAFKKLLEALKA
ncbi:MAG: toll/interleukin-1 receptor domain-containing protein [Chloroflexi bacterium]|nr:toll/interleukin-1 receptor domain-containing protein [Chloroflexota bacterium]